MVLTRKVIIMLNHGKWKHCCTCVCWILVLRSAQPVCIHLSVYVPLYTMQGTRPKSFCSPQPELGLGKNSQCPFSKLQSLLNEAHAVHLRSTHFPFDRKQAELNMKRSQRPWNLDAGCFGAECPTMSALCVTVV